MPNKRLIATAMVVAVTSFFVVDNVEAASTPTTTAANVTYAVGAAQVTSNSIQLQSLGLQTSQPSAELRPMWTRNCSWWTCTVYFNKRETYLIHIGGSYVSSVACGALRIFVTFAICASVGWLIGAWADRAYSAGKCVYVRFPRVAPVVITGVGSYGPSWRCV